MLSIVLHLHCFLKRKNNQGNALDLPHAVQYDEIDNIHITSGNIHHLSINMQEPVNSISSSGFEGMAIELSSSDKMSSSDSSVQRLSISPVNDDGYEHPYQTVDLGNIEMHPYSIVCSHLYENTIVFPKKNTIKNSNKRDPWLIIYKQV